MVLLLTGWHVLLILAVLWLVAGRPTRRRQRLAKRTDRLAALRHAMAAVEADRLILRHRSPGLRFFCTHCGEPAGWSCEHVRATGDPVLAPERVAVQADPDLRIGDAERDATLAQLREHYAAGRLTAEELSGRLDATLAAKTQRQLDVPLADLPELPDGAAST